MSASGLRVDDRVIVLTGASSGLGVQFAEALSGAGARLVLSARRGDRLDAVAAKLPGETATVVADVADPDDRAAIIATARERFGRIDGLVNNAGTAAVSPALKESVESFTETLAVNLVAPFALMKGAAAAMRDQGDGGAVVNISSIVGQIPVSWQPNAAYAASKGGLIAMTRDLASQWARYGIRVNSIAPGAFASEMSGDAYLKGETRERILGQIPLGRIGAAGEIDALLILLLHQASSYITGQTIAVDGGLSTSL